MNDDDLGELLRRVLQTDDLVMWGQGPGFYLMPRELADLVRQLSDEYNAMVVVISNGRPGGILPQLLPRTWESR